MAGRGLRCGPAQVTPLGACRRAVTVAYRDVRGVRPGYMLTTPAAGRGGQRDGAGEAPGAAAPTGAGGAAARVEDQVCTARCYTPQRRWRRTRADAAAVPVRAGAGAAAPVQDRGQWTSRKHAGGVMSRLRRGPELGLGWPGSTLRWTGRTCRAASLDSPDEARREMPAGRRLDRVEGGDSRRTGRPGRTTSHYVQLEVGSC